MQSGETVECTYVNENENATGVFRSPKWMDEGEPYTLAMVQPDGGAPGDTYSYGFACGDVDADGDPVWTDWSLANTYLCDGRNGTNPVQVGGRIQDGAGGSTEYFAMMDVYNNPPVPQAPAALGFDDVIDPGTLVEVIVPFTDPWSGDKLFTSTANWNWLGGGTNEAGPSWDAPAPGVLTFSHTYAAAGIYYAKFCVTDSGVGQANGCDYSLINIGGVSLFVAGADLTVASGEAVSLAGVTFADPTVGATQQAASINWGDGVVTDGAISGDAISGDHQYGADGVYEVEVCVTNEVGVEGCGTVEVTVGGEPGAVCSLNYDLNGDNFVDMDDLMLVLTNSMFYGVAYDAKYDLNQDGMVDIDDLFMVIRNSAKM